MHSLGSLGGTPGIPLVYKSVRYNSFLVLEASFGDKRGPVGAPSPCVLVISWSSPLLMCAF